MSWMVRYYSAAVQRVVLSLPKGILADYLRLADVILHSFVKKTPATPRKELEIALKRMKEMHRAYPR